MGSRGPLKVVGGQAQATRRGGETAATVVPPMEPEKPAGIAAHEELSVMWDETVRDMKRAGMVAPVDAAVIEQMLLHRLTARMAFREIEKTGSVIITATKDDYGDRKHPAEVILRQESAALMEYLKQMGFTWMSRARTAATATGGADGANPFEGSEATG